MYGCIRIYNGLQRQSVISIAIAFCFFSKTIPYFDLIFYFLFSSEKMWFTKVSTTAPFSYCQLIQQLMSLLFRSFISGEIAFLPVQFLAKFMEQYRCVVVRRKRRRNSIIKIHAALATTNYSLCV